MNIVCEENCRNAPKKRLLKDFTIALAKNEAGFCLVTLHEEVSWEIIGKQTVQGNQNALSAWKEFNQTPVKELIIQHIITHGNTASVNGSLVYDASRRIEFCHVVKFGSFGKNAKIKTITSYMIDV